MKKEEIEQKEKELVEKGVKHRIITAYVDDDTEETVTFFLRKPDLTARNLLNKVVNKDGGIQGIYAAIKNLWIAGDAPETIQNNDYALMSCDNAVTEMFAVKRSTLKKN